MGGSAIGFLFVGPRDDFGYNQAAYMGSEAVEAAFDQYEILRAENVPENQEAERVMENMIRSGVRSSSPLRTDTWTRAEPWRSATPT
ncbi:MAG: hypothetical protein R2911_03165 [Caldilineaceae bacterium]